MPRPATREGAIEEHGAEIPDTSVGLHEWLDAARLAPRTNAAAFDTRMDHPKLITKFDHAAKTEEKLLRGLGATLVAPAEHFTVTDTTGPLADGEEERARGWGRPSARSWRPARPTRATDRRRAEPVVDRARASHRRPRRLPVRGRPVRRLVRGPRARRGGRVPRPPRRRGRPRRAPANPSTSSWRCASAPPSAGALLERLPNLPPARHHRDAQQVHRRRGRHGARHHRLRHRHRSRPRPRS